MAEPSQVPFVTVIIPTLNEAGRIEACLASVFSQDYPADRFEVLVADGGSTDDTRQEVLAMAVAYSQIRLIDNPRRIQSAAFNLGVKEGKGDVFVRMDAHARYDQTYIRKCVETLHETGAANAGGVWEIMPGADTLLARAIVIVNTTRFGIGGARFRVGGQAGPVDTVPFGAFPRSTFDKAGLLDERLPRGEDNEYNARIRQKGLTVWFDPEIRCTYFARGTLAGFMKQMFGNGLFHIATLRVNPGGCSWRHFVPLVFVVGLLGLGVAGFFWAPAWWALLAMLGLYMLADVAATVQACRAHGWRYVAALPWLYLLTHLTYGLGTLLGVFRFSLVLPGPPEKCRCL